MPIRVDVEQLVRRSGCDNFHRLLQFIAPRFDRGYRSRIADPYLGENCFDPVNPIMMPKTVDNAGAPRLLPISTQKFQHDLGHFSGASR